VVTAPGSGHKIDITIIQKITCVDPPRRGPFQPRQHKTPPGGCAKPAIVGCGFGTKFRRLVRMLGEPVRSRPSSGAVSAHRRPPAELPRLPSRRKVAYRMQK